MTHERSHAEIWAGLSPATQDLLRADPNAPLPAGAEAEIIRAGGAVAAAWWKGDTGTPGGHRLPAGFQQYIAAVDRPEGDINS